LFLEHILLVLANEPFEGGNSLIFSCCIAQKYTPPIPQWVKVNNGMHFSETNTL